MVDLGETGRNGEVKGAGDAGTGGEELTEDIAVELEGNLLRDAGDQLGLGVHAVEGAEVVGGLGRPASLELPCSRSDGLETDVDVDIGHQFVGLRVVVVRAPDEVARRCGHTKREVGNLTGLVVDGTRQRTGETTRAVVDVALDHGASGRDLFDGDLHTRVSVQWTDWAVLENGAPGVTGKPCRTSRDYRKLLLLHVLRRVELVEVLDQVRSGGRGALLLSVDVLEEEHGSHGGSHLDVTAKALYPRLLTVSREVRLYHHPV